MKADKAVEDGAGFRQWLNVAWGTEGPAITPAMITNLPADALKVRVRQRRKTEARAFVRFADRVEHWVLGYNNDNDLVLLLRIGSNAK